MKPVLLLLLCIGMPLAAMAAQENAGKDADPGADRKSKGNWLSFLVPKAFDKNPKVDLNVITEMTAAGRKITPPTPDAPAFYVVHPIGYLRLGQGAPARESSPPPEFLTDAMQDALAANGYRVAPEPDERASLVVVFYWGSYTSAGWDAEATNAELAAEAAGGEAPARPRMHGESSDELLPLVLTDLAKRQELLERASLVGGVKFAGELQKVLNEEVDFEDVRANEARLAQFMASSGGGGLVGGPTLGGAVAGDISSAFRSFNPFYRFKNRDARTAYLVEQAFGSFYFVVASAYDYASVARNERILLWRTKMTVDSNGVSMMETLRPLIASAAPHFGVEMAGTATISRRIDREGKVEIGPTTVIEYLDPAQPAPATEDEPAPAPAASGTEKAQP